MLLLDRGRYFNRYIKPEGSFIFQTGGDISNRQPWDGSSEEWTPESFTLADIVNEGGNIRSISSGHWKYAFNKGTTLQGGFAGNEFRVYPVRGDHSVFYSIAPQTPVDLSYEVIPSRKAIKIYKDTPDVQYAFYVGIDGWKLANFLRATYGSDTFQQKFNVRLEGGIQRVGRTLVYQGKVVGKLPTPQFTENATGDAYDITESINGGELILSIAGLNALDLSQGGIFDPTLGPINNSKDAHIVENIPTTGWGQEGAMDLRGTTGAKTRTIIQFDVSAIPAGSTVNSSTFEIYHETNILESADGLGVDILRLTTYDWEENGTGTADAEANYDNYKDPNVAWPGGSGAFGDTDATGKVSATVPVVGAWMQSTPDILTQDAIDSRGGLLNLLVKYTTENTANNKVARFSSLQSATAAWRPKLTVVYAAGGGGPLQKPLGWIPPRRLLRQF